MIFTVLGFIFEPGLQLSPAITAAVEVCVYAAAAASAAAAAAWNCISAEAAAVAAALI